MNIWNIVNSLEGNTLYTLDLKRSSPFLVEKVTNENITIKNSRGLSRNISRNKIIDCWETLIEQSEIDLNIGMDVKLRLGGNASYIAAILAHMPNVVVHKKPIVLEYKRIS
jgi:hypothetical protein